jgi:diguanylate cyclase (GGDEF)-like protein
LFNVLRPAPATIGDEDLRLLTSLASYTALAITHLEISLRLRDLSITDELTGVANRRFLGEKLRREIERVRRTGKPLAALMLDLDHFKKVNDEKGHLAGDEVLRGVARALRDCVRRLDTVARYGGEEFVVLLPDSPRAQALLVGEKLRTAVSSLDLGVGKLTISVGVAVFPEDADGEQTLLDAADRALLAAKRSGRDRVVLINAG